MLGAAGGERDTDREIERGGERREVVEVEGGIETD